MNRRFPLTVIALFLSLTATAGQVVDKIVAKIDDQVITESDLREATRLEQSGFIPTAVKGRLSTRQEILTRLVDERVFTAELDLNKISIIDSEVDAAIDSIIASHHSTLEKLKAALAASNLPFEKFREKIRNDLRRRQFIQQIIIPRLRMSDVELEDYYRKHQNQFMGYEKIRFQQILLTPESLPAGTTMPDFIVKIMTQLRNGASFTEAAKKYSKGPFSEKGGDSGLVDTATLRPELVSSLTALPLNFVSDPVTMAPDQVFIFKVLERKNPGPRPFVHIKDMVRQAYMNEKIGQEMEKYLAQARDRHFVEIKK